MMQELRPLPKRSPRGSAPDEQLRQESSRHMSSSVLGTAGMPQSGQDDALPGTVGLQLSAQGPPFLVEGEAVLMDEQGLLQGDEGYQNPAVQLNDMLVAVNGYDVDELELAAPGTLQHVLKGPRASLVHLTFVSAATGEEFDVYARRHAIQQLHQAVTSEEQASPGGIGGYDVGLIIGRPDLQDDEHPVFVVDLAPGGSAHRCQEVNVGDELLAVDGSECFGQPIVTIASRLIGPKGSIATLEFRKPNEISERRLRLRREPYPSQESGEQPQGCSGKDLSPNSTHSVSSSSLSDYVHEIMPEKELADLQHRQPPKTSIPLQGRTRKTVELERAPLPGTPLAPDGLAGVGFCFETTATGMQIISSLEPAGSAQSSGRMQAGDVLRTVDGVDVQGLSVKEVISLVRGPPGTKVVLELDSVNPKTGRLDITRSVGSFDIRSIPSVAHPSMQPKSSRSPKDVPPLDNSISRADNQWCTTLTSYKPQYPDELGFTKGQLIEIGIEPVEPGWYEGTTLSGEKGLVPITHVRILQESSSVASPETSPSRKSASSKVADLKLFKARLNSLVHEGNARESAFGARKGRTVDARRKEMSLTPNDAIQNGDSAQPVHRAPKEADENQHLVKENKAASSQPRAKSSSYGADLVSKEITKSEDDHGDVGDAQQSILNDEQEYGGGSRTAGQKRLSEDEKDRKIRQLEQSIEDEKDRKIRELEQQLASLQQQSRFKSHMGARASKEARARTERKQEEKEKKEVEEEVVVMEGKGFFKANAVNQDSERDRATQEELVTNLFPVLSPAAPQKQQGSVAGRGEQPMQSDMTSIAEDESVGGCALPTLVRPADSADNLVALVRQFYSIYAPEKVENAQTVVKIYENNLVGLNQALAKKYNAYIDPDGRGIIENLPNQQVSPTNLTRPSVAQPLEGSGVSTPKVLQTELSSADTVPGISNWSRASSAASNDVMEKHVNLLIKLDLDHAYAGLEETPQRVWFIQNLTQDLGNASGMHPANFHILRIAPGIVLDAQIHPCPSRRDQTPMMVANLLERQVADQTSVLHRGVLSKYIISISVPDRVQSSQIQGSSQKAKSGRELWKNLRGPAHLRTQEKRVEAGESATGNIFDVFSRSMKGFTSKSSEQSAHESSAVPTLRTPPSLEFSNNVSERSRRKQPFSVNPPLLSAKIENSPHILHPQAVEDRMMRRSPREQVPHSAYALQTCALDLGNYDEIQHGVSEIMVDRPFTPSSNFKPVPASQQSEKTRLPTSSPQVDSAIPMPVPKEHRHQQVFQRSNYPHDQRATEEALEGPRPSTPTGKANQRMSTNTPSVIAVKRPTPKVLQRVALAAFAAGENGLIGHVGIVDGHVNDEKQRAEAREGFGGERRDNWCVL